MSTQTRQKTLKFLASMRQYSRKWVHFGPIWTFHSGKFTARREESESGVEKGSSGGVKSESESEKGPGGSGGAGRPPPAKVYKKKKLEVVKSKTLE